MFLPIGDDVNKREFPVVGIMLIALNFFVYCYQTGLWFETRESLRGVDVSQVPDSAIREIIGRTEYFKFINTWGCSATNVKNGHFMCMLTAIFLHADIFHLLGNMIVLWAFAGTLESALGQARFFFLYLLWGVGASLAQVLANWNSDIPGIGASGAIAGMLGAYFVTFGALTKLKCLIFIFLVPFVVNVPAALFALLWLLSQLSGLDDAIKYGVTSVGWYAHLGGFGIGAVTMLAFVHEAKKRIYRDQAGVLHFRTEKQMAEIEAAEQGALAAAATEGLPAESTAEVEEQPAAPAQVNCPFCGAVVPEENRIHSSMMRCKSCDRLIMK